MQLMLSLVLIFASWMLTNLVVTALEQLVVSTKRGLIMPTGKKVGCFLPDVVVSFPLPKCMSYSREEASLMPQKTFMAQVGAGTECCTVVAASRENPQDHFRLHATRYSRSPGVLVFCLF